jgi:hypothetical protein
VPKKEKKRGNKMEVNDIFYVSAGHAAIYYVARRPTNPGLGYVEGLSLDFYFVNAGFCPFIKNRSVLEGTKTVHPTTLEQCGLSVTALVAN